MTTEADVRGRLGEVYPARERERHADRLGLSARTMKAICLRTRVPSERVAQRMSVETGLSVAELRGWDWTPPAGVRWRADDPQPMAQAAPEHVEQRVAVRLRIAADWLTQLVDDRETPAALRDAARRLLAFAVADRSAL